MELPIRFIRKRSLLTVLLFLSSFTVSIAQSASENNSANLVGVWTIDMTPENTIDSNFAMMEITAFNQNQIQGFFYRAGVEIRNGHVNYQTDAIHAAFVSGDNSGDYNTSFHYKNGVISGTTHALDKNFLSVWTGHKLEGNSFQPSFKISTETTHKISKDQAFTFGYLKVLENRSNPTSKTIEIPVYIFKSRSEKPKLDPIIYTVGGPGSTTMPSAQYMRYYKYLDDRDFILIEQRGNYYARPHLGCPEWSEAVYLSNLPTSNELDMDSLFESAARDCRERLTNNDIDLSAYNTNEIAADVADLVHVLEIDSFNLLTLSYSTKIAQVMLRDYPKGIRSVVMDSPLPLEVNFDEQSVENLLASLDKLLLDCENDPACNGAYPEIRERFINLLSEASLNPLALEVENPLNGKTEIFKLKGNDLILVFSDASSSEVPNVPYEINKILNNDYSSIKDELSNIFYKPNGGDGIGMRLSVWCAEEFPFNDQQIISKETYNHPEVYGLSPAVFDSSTCHIWAVSKKKEAENLPVKSNVPVLLLCGEYDHLTPKKWAFNMQKNLRNSFLFEFKGWQHGITTYWDNSCGMDLAVEFFNNPLKAPNVPCFQAIKTPNFKIE